MEHYKFEITDENKNDLTLEEVKLIFDQSNKTLHDTIESRIIITARTTTLLTLITGLIIALVSYCFSTWQKTHYLSPDILASIGIALYSFIISLALVINIQGAPYHILGSEPKYLLNNELFDTKDKNIRTILFYLSEIEANQFKIEDNKLNNKKRWDLFNIALWGIAMIPALLCIYYFASDQMTNLFCRCFSY